MIRTPEQLRTVMADRRLHLRIYPTAKFELWIDDRVVHTGDLRSEEEEGPFGETVKRELGITDEEYASIESMWVSEVV